MKPTRSQKRHVTTLRSSRCASGERAVAHHEQNPALVGVSRPLLGQAFIEQRIQLYASLAFAMSPQRRTALVSVGAACLLVVIKLVAGIASSSLGLLAEAAHSGTDLAAALLTFFAVSVSVRPADRGHHYGHAKAQNLAALAEAGFLVAVSIVIAVLAVLRLTGVVDVDVSPTWWSFAAIALVLVIDASRTTVSLRGARLYRSDALLANALHFGSDFAGTLAVLGGLIAAALGFADGDSIAALFVSALVVAAAVRLGRRNVDVLMDRSPESDTRLARDAIAGLEPPVELRRLRLRRAGESTSRTSSSGSRRALPSDRGTQPPIGSRRRCTTRCRESTPSCTSSRETGTLLSGSECWRRRSPSRRSARSTTSPCSRSPDASRCRST